MSSDPREADFVFNVVITPWTFRYLKWFTCSLISQSDVRLRLVANGCPREDVRRMRAFVDGYEGRVELLELSASTMVAHGAALEEIYDARDDGDYFCFVDSDVKARHPFMSAFLDLIAEFAAITSCNVAWSDDTVLAPGARDLVGRHAVGHDGFVYGSSYLAIYSRAAVEQVRKDWGVTFRAGAYGQLPKPVQHRLVTMGRQFELYDTAKVLNILLQSEGLALAHVDNPALFHVGGISQYLSDPSVRASVSRPTASAAAAVPWFAASGASRERWDFASWAAATLRGLVEGGAIPALPEATDEAWHANVVQRELLDLAQSYGHSSTSG